MTNVFAGVFAVFLLISCGASSTGDLSKSSLVDLASRESPVAGILFGTDDRGVLAGQEMAVAIGEEAQRCMLEAGFDAASIPPTVVEEPSSTRTRLRRELGQEAYARQYGFGHASAVLAEIDGGQDHSEEDVRGFIAELSPGEANAWVIALYGPEASIDETGGVDTGGSAASGCIGSSIASVLSRFREADEVLGDSYQGLEGRIARDPRMIDLANRWSTCMRGRGYDYTQPGALDSELRFRAEELRRELDPDFSEGIRSKVMDLRATEIDLAIASFECSTGMRSVAVTVRQEYEIALIEENLAAIELFVESRDG